MDPILHIDLMIEEESDDAFAVYWGEDCQGEYDTMNEAKACVLAILKRYAEDLAEEILNVTIDIQADDIK